MDKDGSNHHKTRTCGIAVLWSDEDFFMQRHVSKTKTSARTHTHTHMRRSCLSPYYRVIMGSYGANTRRREPKQVALRPVSCPTMAAQWRPDSFAPPCWIVDERPPQRHADFDKAVWRARRAASDAKKYDRQLPAWTAAMLNVTYIPVSGWPDYQRLFLEIRERMVPRGPPPPLPMAIQDVPKAPPPRAAIEYQAPAAQPAPRPLEPEPTMPPPPPPAIGDAGYAPSAVVTTADIAIQTEALRITAVERPSWIRFEDPTTGRKFWVNNLAGESFYEDNPTPWKCWHCDTTGQRYWVKMREGADWETLPAFWE